VAGEPSSAPAATTGPAHTTPGATTPAAAAPATTGAPAKPKASAAPTKDDPAPAAGKHTYAFPVAASDVAFHPTHSKYPATDVFADCGQPVVAMTNGTILEISLVDRYVKGKPDGPYNGGLSVSLLGEDGVRYYGSHLSKVQSGIKAGVRVTAGQKLGQVGHTGNANGVCHLHVGFSPPCAGTGDWKVRRGVIWPATYLTSWRKKGSKSPVAAAAAWKKSHNCQA
jgi:murein DD-endopeptidase MepM/ murein hydrolase activator NlpD